MGLCRRPAQWHLLLASLFVGLGLVFSAACGSEADQNATVAPTEGQVATATTSTDATATTPAPPDPEGYRGLVLETPLEKPSFTLPDTSGQTFDFAKETEGYVTLLYFGYTYCPDICPGNLAVLGKALENLPADVSDQVKVVFVSSDPARDTPERLRQWLDNFGEEFVGLIPANLERVNDIAARALAQPGGIIWQPITYDDLGDGDYAVTHPAVIVAYTTDNLGHVVYPFGVKVADWEHDLPKLVKEGFAE